MLGVSLQRDAYPFWAVRTTAVMEPTVYNLMEDVTETLTSNRSAASSSEVKVNHSDNNDKEGAGVETVVQKNLPRLIGVKKAKKQRRLQEQETTEDKKPPAKNKAKVTASGSVSSMDTMFVQTQPHPVHVITDALKSIQDGMATKSQGLMCLELAKLGLALNEREKAVKYFTKAEALYEATETDKKSEDDKKLDDDKTEDNKKMNDDTKTVSTGVGETSTESSVDTTLQYC